MIPNVFNAYQRFTATIAVYPATISGNVRSIYLPLGLAEEAGELAEKICAFTAQNLLFHEPKLKTSKESILREVGDVIWYCARILDSDSMLLGDCVGATYNGPASLDHIALTICANAGIVAGRAKKLLRDGASWNDADLIAKYHDPQHDAIKVILASLHTLCRFFGTTLEKVAYENQVKITSRQERGKLNGDGDNR